MYDSDCLISCNKRYDYVGNLLDIPDNKDVDKNLIMFVAKILCLVFIVHSVQRTIMF